MTTPFMLAFEESGDLGWVVAVLVMIGVSAGTWWAFWQYSLRPMRKRLYGYYKELEALKNDYGRLKGEFIMLKEASRTSAWLRPVESLQKEVHELREFTEQWIEKDHPPERSAATVLTQWASTFTSAPAPRPAAADDGAPPPPTAAPVLVPPGREQLGAWFVQEIKTCEGMDSAAVWERYLARLKPILREADSRVVHWDRVASEPRFHEHPASHFSDTGKCWLMQAGGQSLLFFPALAQSARKNDLPGCQIISSGEAILYSSRLAEFTPPVVMQSSDGWTVQTGGSAEYH